ncbi:hypothetical protein Cci01nite_17010 [Catellatospora citrea]|uniref:Uncharacterized protein n=2 Tax=Catellatospora citrea TaxID=53366 RepID=A0A8J3KBJ9_9ACTN|nr:hypothetical protein Cci01nite_17010 [Catellatospora citrea]
MDRVVEQARLVEVPSLIDLGGIPLAEFVTDDGSVLNAALHRILVDAEWDSGHLISAFDSRI